MMLKESELIVQQMLAKLREESRLSLRGLLF